MKNLTFGKVYPLVFVAANLFALYAAVMHSLGPQMAVNTVVASASIGAASVILVIRETFGRPFWGRVSLLMSLFVLFLIAEASMAGFTIVSNILSALGAAFLIYASRHSVAPRQEWPESSKALVAKINQATKGGGILALGPIFTIGLFITLGVIIVAGPFLIRMLVGH